MTTTQVGGILALIDGAPKADPNAPGYGLEFHVRDANGTYLALLEGARNKQYLADLLGCGAGSFVINASDAKATSANLANENIVEVRWAGTTIGYWLIQRRRQAIVADTADAEEIEVSGQGVLAWLKKAVLYPLSWPALTDPDSQQAPIICGPSAGAGLLGIWSSNIDLPLVVGFSMTTDSNDTDWPQDVYIEFRANQTLLDVIDALRGRGYDVMISSTSLTLQAYVSAGTTRDVHFRQGHNIVSCNIEYDSGDLATVVLGEGQDVLVEGTDFTWSARRQQAALSARNATNEAQVTAVVDEYLARVHEPVTAIELAVVQSALTTLPAYGVDYYLGDAVSVIVPGKIDTIYRVLSAQLSELNNDPRTVIVNLGLNQVNPHVGERLKTVIDAGAPIAAGGAYNLVARDSRTVRNLVTFDWLLAGTVSAGDGQGPIYEVRERVRLLDFTGNVQTAPGSTGSVSLQYSLDQGTTWIEIFEDTVPSFPAGETRMVPGVFSVTLLQLGTWLRFSVDAAGSGAMADLSVRLRTKEV